MSDFAEDVMDDPREANEWLRVVLCVLLAIGEEVPP